MSEVLGERGARSMPEAEIAAVDDPWLEDQTTTRYTRMETDPAAQDMHGLRGAAPSWSRVLTVCFGAASCLLFGQLLWSTRTVPPAAAMTQREPTASDARSPSLPLIEETMSPAPRLDSTAAAGAPVVSSKPVAAKKRREQRKLRGVVSEAQPLGLAATMHIDSHPWSHVTVDGHPIGRTPHRGVSLTPGKHKVLLHSPDTDVLKILVLHVLPGETIERVEQLK